MAANTKQIKGDVDRKPSPQYYNPVADEYEYLYGENGASRHILYSSDGQPITSSGNKLAVRASEIETLLSDIKSKDFATQTTLAAILAKLISAPATEAKQTALNALIGEVQAAPTANTLLARLKNLEDKIDKITAGTSPAVTTLAGRNVAKTKVTNWVNAETIRAGGSKTYYYPTLNYPDELYLLMRIDKQPWSITGSTPFMTVAGDRHIFPNYDLQNPATITASSTYEMITLFVTGGFSKAYRGIGFNPATLDEAKKRALPMQGLSGKTLSFYNKHATDDCTLSIQLLEVWR